MPILVLVLYLEQQPKDFCSLESGTSTIPSTQGVPEHNCFHNWSGSSCSMEANIILEGFQLSEQMHGVHYHWFICDGDSSVYHALVSGVPSYGIVIKKVECANHTVKCYRNRLEGVCNDKPAYCSKRGLSKSMMKKITHGVRCAIKMHSATGGVAALCHDLQNGPRHYFGLHDKCSSIFCKYKDTLPKYIAEGNQTKILIQNSH